LQHCHHGGIYSVNSQKEIKIDFSSNINPLGISKKVLEKLRTNIRLAYIYPDPKCTELKKKIIEYIDCEFDLDSNENLITGNGATELIHYFAASFARKKTLIPTPTFCEYELAAKRKNSKLVFVPPLDNTFQIDSDSISKLTKNPDNEIGSVFLCNPNNPTGKFFRKEILEILEKIDKKIPILLDESYIEFTDTKKKNENNYFVDLIKDINNLVILRSLTKTFGLAGLRVGYALSTRENIQKLNDNLISWNVNGLAQVAAIEALKDKSHINAARKNNISEKKRIFKSLEENRKIRAISSDVNFYLIEILSEKTSTELTSTLLVKNQILVRDCKTFTGMNDKFIRVAIKTPKENNVLLNSLEGAL
jgi:threonine-phosphate decarboxylase